MFSAQMKLNQIRASQIISLRLKDTSFRHSGEIETQRVGRNQSIYGRVLQRKEFQNLKRKKRKLFALKSLLLRKSGASYLLTVLQTFRKLSFLRTLNKALNEYDNLLFTGDLNINTLRPTSGSSNHLSDLNDTFSLTNLVTDSTYFKSSQGSLIDLMLTDKPKSFYKCHSFVTGLSHCHNLIASILSTSFKNFHPNL